MSQTASKGRVVFVKVDPTMNNGDDTAHASITRVWGEHPEGGRVVNIRVTLDAFAQDLWLTSVRLFDTEAEADAVRHLSPGACYWPPRV